MPRSLLRAPASAELATVLDRLASVVRRLPSPGGLSLSAAATLVALERTGPARLSALAVSEQLTQPGMTQLVSRLERDGLAERRADPTDGRAVLVALTRAGAELVAARRAARATQLGSLLGGLDADDVAALTSALPALTRLVERGERDILGRTAGDAGAPSAHQTPDRHAPRSTR